MNRHSQIFVLAREISREIVASLAQRLAARATVAVEALRAGTTVGCGELGSGEAQLHEHHASPRVDRVAWTRLAREELQVRSAAMATLVVALRGTVGSPVEAGSGTYCKTRGGGKRHCRSLIADHLALPAMGGEPVDFWEL